MFLIHCTYVDNFEETELYILNNFVNSLLRHTKYVKYFLLWELYNKQCPVFKSFIHGFSFNDAIGYPVENKNEENNLRMTLLGLYLNITHEDKLSLTV